MLIPLCIQGITQIFFYPMGSAQKKVKGYEDEIGIKMVPITPMVYFEDEGRYIPEAEVKKRYES